MNVLEQGDSGSPFNRKIMANDRMYIRCKGCGDLHYLAKCYDDGYFTTHEGEELRQGLDDFFDRHKWCYRDKYYGGFELVYESDEDAENEDERIRKELKEAFEAYDIESKWNGIPIRSIFAWLEKQKEQKNTSASTMAPSCWAEEPSLQKEQKPDWSEEDEKMIKTIISVLERSSQVVTYEQRGGSVSASVGCSDKYKEEIAWLKSLRPSWKPSEEQMEALKRASTNEYLPAKQFDILVSLYEQLKKLM